MPDPTAIAEEIEDAYHAFTAAFFIVTIYVLVIGPITCLQGGADDWADVAAGVLGILFWIGSITFWVRALGL